MDPMAVFRSEVESRVREALASIGAEADFEIEIPPSGIADFAVPCFPLAKVLRRSPTEIAEELSSMMEDMEGLSSVWCERGYLNFKVDETKLVDITLNAIMEGKGDYGRSDARDGKVLLEHTSVNPTGPIHVGRARNPLIGDTLARCLRFGGYDVTTEYYVNDVGKQVVLLTWGLENLDEGDVPPSDRAKEDHRLVGFYRKANQLMESDPGVGEEIGEMLRRFEAGDEEVIARVRRTAERMLEGILQSLGRVGVTLDSFAWESEFIKDGSARSVVGKLKSSQYAQQEEGAYYLDLEEFGVHGNDTRWFFTRRDGTTLYTTRDLAYHLNKFSRAEHLINVLGEDQKLGMKQLASALTIMGEERKPENVFYSFVSLPEGKMSTRRGTVVNLDDLIEEAEARALEEVRKRRTDLSDERMEEIARAIGRGAIRYNIIRVQSEKQLVFRWEEALNFDGNSAPFLQYSHARACSILRKAGDHVTTVDSSLLTDEYEIRLVKVLARFPQVMEECASKRRIHLLPSYGQEVAASFNQFYAYVPVLRSGVNRDARLTLVEATKWVLRNVLDNLGIVALEEM
jgi:arginyl-tRNA synthetase